MSSISTQDLNDQIKKLNGNQQKLDLLIACEEILDNMDLFAFANWEEGEVLEGPEVERHWIKIRLIYPYKTMPDPDGAKRLLKRKCLVSYEKGKLLTPAKVKTPDDLTLETNAAGEPVLKARINEEKVWIVTIQLPRKMVNDFDTAQVRINDEDYIDMESITSNGEKE